MLISFEGIDGSGKTTQAALLVERLRMDGRTVHAVHEPGGTALGADVRGLLLKDWTPPIDPWAEALLFAASRAQLVREVIRPAVSRGEIVVADRFADSTVAYQGAGRGLDRADLALLIRIATDGLRPDLTFLLDIAGHDGLGRRSSTFQTTYLEDAPHRDWNRFENEGAVFQDRVRAAFLDLAAQAPARWIVLDATQGQTELAGAIWNAVASHLSTHTFPYQRP